MATDESADLLGGTKKLWYLQAPVGINQDPVETESRWIDLVR